MLIARAILMLLVSVLVLAGCGGDDAGADDARNSSGSEQADDAEGDTGPVATEPPGDSRTGGSSTFALTPELQRCMEEAGFAQDAPPTASLAAWRHSSGGRVVVASSSEQSVTGGIASEIGAEHEAQVHDEVVIAAPPQQSEAARACLDV